MSRRAGRQRANERKRKRECVRETDSGDKDQSKRAIAAQWSTINMACKRTREAHTHTEQF